MGHRSNDTIEYYKTGIQDIDTQAIIRGRPQRFELIEESISVLDNRDLAAPQPPGARLIDVASRLPQVDRVDSGALEENDSSNDSASESASDSSDHEIEEKNENALPTVLSVTKIGPPCPTLSARYRSCSVCRLSACPGANSNSTLPWSTASFRCCIAVS
jgi:hypothetical protein